MVSTVRFGERLREAGFSGWADRIDSVIDEGYTATEILMGLRWSSSKLRGGGIADLQISPTRSWEASTVFSGEQVPAYDIEMNAVERASRVVRLCVLTVLALVLFLCFSEPAASAPRVLPGGPISCRREPAGRSTRPWSARFNDLEAGRELPATSFEFDGDQLDFCRSCGQRTIGVGLSSPHPTHSWLRRRPAYRQGVPRPTRLLSFGTAKV